MVGTLVFLSPARQGPIAPALPPSMLSSIAGVAGRSLTQPNAAAPGKPGQSPAEAAQAAVTDLVVREAVAQGAARAKETLATLGGPRSRDTLTAQDRLPPWRGTLPKS